MFCLTRESNYCTTFITIFLCLNEIPDSFQKIPSPLKTSSGIKFEIWYQQINSACIPFVTTYNGWSNICICGSQCLMKRAKIFLFRGINPSLAKSSLYQSTIYSDAPHTCESVLLKFHFGFTYMVSLLRRMLIKLNIQLHKGCKKYETQIKKTNHYQS